MQKYKFLSRYANIQLFFINYWLFHASLFAPSHSSIEPLFELRSLVSAAHHLLFLIAQKAHTQFATEIRLQSFHGRDIDDKLAIDTEEAMGIELSLYLIERHGEAIELPLLAHQIDSRILKLRADESNLLHIHHLVAILVRHQESLYRITQKRIVTNLKFDFKFVTIYILDGITLKSMISQFPAT